MKKYYYAFAGNVNTSCGQPNRITGRHSTWGQLYAFHSKADRNAFCDTYNQRFNSYPVPCNATTARQYFLGNTVREYEEHLHWIQCEAQ
jgi:hypothetical protein